MSLTRSFLYLAIAVICFGAFPAWADSDPTTLAPQFKTLPQPSIRPDPAENSNEAKWKREEVMQKALGQRPPVDHTNDIALMIGIPLMMFITITAMMHLRDF